MLLHDPSDIFLEAAKISQYLGHEATANVFFVLLLVTWMTTRLFLLPFWLINSALCATPPPPPPHPYAHHPLPSPPLPTPHTPIPLTHNTSNFAKMSVTAVPLVNALASLHLLKSGIVSHPPPL
jgi:hypothetical protein